MPRTPRNPGSGKRPHNGPARGAGVGGPAAGAGWGGPASGRTPGDTPQPFGADNPAPPRYRTPEELAARKNELIRRTDEYLDMLDTIARDGTEPATVRIMAMDKATNRIEGTPVQRTLTAEVEPSAILDIRAPIEDFLAEWTPPQSEQPTKH